VKGKSEAGNFSAAKQNGAPCTVTGAVFARIG
jgi:hypothetical protein